MTIKMTPFAQYEVDVRRAKNLDELREARERFEAATGAGELRGNAAQPQPKNTAQAFREAFSQLGMDDGMAATAAAGRYGTATPPAPAAADRPADPLDAALAAAYGWPAGSPEAVAFRRGRYQ